MNSFTDILQESSIDFKKCCVLFWSSFKWRVTVSGELMFLESYGNCDVTNTVTLLL